jgi:hypothetical protein
MELRHPIRADDGPDERLLFYYVACAQREFGDSLEVRGAGMTVDAATSTVLRTPAPAGANGATSTRGHCGCEPGWGITAGRRAAGAFLTHSAGCCCCSRRPRRCPRKRIGCRNAIPLQSARDSHHGRVLAPHEVELVRGAAMGALGTHFDRVALDALLGRCRETATTAADAAVVASEDGSRIGWAAPAWDGDVSLYRH